MRLYFYGGAGVVAGVNYLLETSKEKLLIDCGLFQGGKELEKKNLQSFPYQPKEIDFVLISHAHLDHIGRLPQLVSQGFQGRIFATGPTIDFTHLMLEDSQKILHEKMVRAGVIPLMNGQQIDKMMKMFQRVEYGQPVKLNQGITVCFQEAGHVLGSAIIEIFVRGKKIIFSGDLGSGQTAILKKPAEIKEADYVIIESTYGDRLHETAQTCKDMIEDITEETMKQDGILMIPSFALERTQQLLYHFNELVENHRIDRVPIFVDSPLATKLTEIYRRYPQYYDREADLLIKSGDDIFKFPGLKFTLSAEESKAINQIAPPKIIIAGSGMSQGGRILHHEARYLSDPKSTLLIVTYQAKGTLGRRLLEGAKRVKILDQIVSVKAKVEKINGFSSHADQKCLLNWLANLVKPGVSRRPKQIFVCQGEEEPANVLAQKIRDHLGLRAEVPKIGEMVSLK